MEIVVPQPPDKGEPDFFLNLIHFAQVFWENIEAHDIVRPHHILGRRDGDDNALVNIDRADTAHRFRDTNDKILIAAYLDPLADRIEPAEQVFSDRGPKQGDLFPPVNLRLSKESPFDRLDMEELRTIGGDPDHDRGLKFLLAVKDIAGPGAERDHVSYLRNSVFYGIDVAVDKFRVGRDRLVLAGDHDERIITGAQIQYLVGDKSFRPLADRDQRDDREDADDDAEHRQRRAHLV